MMEHYTLSTVDAQTGKEGSWKVSVTGDTMLQLKAPNKTLTISVRSLIAMYVREIGLK